MAEHMTSWVKFINQNINKVARNNWAGKAFVMYTFDMNLISNTTYMVSLGLLPAIPEPSQESSESTEPLSMAPKPSKTKLKRTF